MSKKTERAYKTVFNKMLSIILEWQPLIAIVHFYNGAIASIPKCWFHSSQATWRKVAKIGKLTLKFELPL